MFAALLIEYGLTLLYALNGETQSSTHLPPNLEELRSDSKLYQDEVALPLTDVASMLHFFQYFLKQSHVSRYAEVTKNFNEKRDDFYKSPGSFD